MIDSDGFTSGVELEPNLDGYSIGLNVSEPVPVPPTGAEIIIRDPWQREIPSSFLPKLVLKHLIHEVLGVYLAD